MLNYENPTSHTVGEVTVAEVRPQTNRKSQESPLDLIRRLSLENLLASESGAISLNLIQGLPSGVKPPNMDSVTQKQYETSTQLIKDANGNNIGYNLFWRDSNGEAQFVCVVSDRVVSQVT